MSDLRSGGSVEFRRDDVDRSAEPLQFIFDPRHPQVIRLHRPSPLQGPIFLPRTDVHLDLEEELRRPKHQDIFVFLFRNNFRKFLDVV